ncbi:hypothetical protein N2152v2_004315 [Parachlorella kessleri]
MEDQLATMHMLRGSGSAQAQFQYQVQDSLSKVQAFEDEFTQAMALSMMPLDRLTGAAGEACELSRAMGEEPPLAHEDALVLELLAWFKGEFFRWVNSPSCSWCGQQTQGQGTVKATAEEAADGAGRTELFRCTACGAQTRFPRYNSPIKLLETRQGRAAGLEVRHVHDFADHVWGEHWSPAQKRWVHVDPCEAAYDKPLLYSAGWGKKLGYVLAVGKDGAADVSRRYCQDWREMQSQRNSVAEGWLQGYLASVTQQLRAALTPDERQALEERDRLEKAQLEQAGQEAPAAEALALPGRTSGSEAWRAGRGENDGKTSAGSGGSKPAAQRSVELPGTHYQLARDEHLRAAQRQWGERVCGGAVRASGENPPSETAARVSDGNPQSKWLDFGGNQPNQAWLEYRLPVQAPALALASYALASANDSPERDPGHWVLEAWVEVEDERRERSGGSIAEGAARDSNDDPAASSVVSGSVHLERPDGQGAGADGSASSAAVVHRSGGGSAVTGSSSNLDNSSTAGSAQAKGSWATLDEQQGVVFPSRHARLQFRLPAEAQGLVARRWRLRVVNTARPANSVQLACWDLYALQPDRKDSDL